MKTSEVAKLSPLDRFLYWIRERHTIYLKRKNGLPKPWTDDEVLQNFFFTNPYRENDKVTVWFRENIREPLRDDPAVLFATVCFRWFNLPATGGILLRPFSSRHKPLIKVWDPELALSVLGKVRDEGGQIFTGAFMINSPPGKPKLEAIVERITNVWKARETLLDEISRGLYEGKLTMQGVHELLTEFPGMGGFMAYEVVCDLRYTYMLENAPDKLTWCNPGPGAVRGLYRILGIPFDASNNATSPPVPKDFLEQCRKLLKIVQQRLRGMPPFEMREIEHSLCESDKYNRILFDEGKAKRRYQGA